MWYKGNLHIHTSEGDGSMNPEDIVKWYRDNQYDFIALTDHNHITNIDINQKKDFLVIDNSFEFGQWDSFLHILGIGMQNKIKIPDIKQKHQEKIKFINDNKGMSIICHPNWYWTECRFSDLMRLDDYCGIEIYNSLMKAEAGSPFALEKWDHVLSSGRKIWGFAVDDLHKPLDDLIGKGWIMVNSEKLTREDITTAINKGNFYSTTGAKVKSQFISKGIINIDSENGEEIVFIGENGKILKTENGQTGTLSINDFDSKYIRVEIRSREGIAFTQPFFKEDMD